MSCSPASASRQVAIGADPKNPLAKFERANVLLSMERLADALAELQVLKARHWIWETADGVWQRGCMQHVGPNTAAEQLSLLVRRSDARAWTHDQPLTVRWMRAGPGAAGGERLVPAWQGAQAPGAARRGVDGFQYGA